MKDRKAPERAKIDPVVFGVSVALTLGIVFALFVFPDESRAVTTRLFDGVLENFGFIYTWGGAAALLACFYFSFSKYGKVKFGDKDEKPEYSTFVWAATLFTAGIAAAILYWSPIEWTYYYTDPALGVESESWEAAEYAASYNFFHWGPVPWALYAICSMPVGYSYYTRKKPVMKISEPCREILGDRVDGIIGKVIDILFILAIVMCATTELGISTPLVTTAICTVLGIEPTLTIEYVVLLIITVVFALAAYFGLKKGLTKLGTLNTYVAIGIVIFIFIVGPTLFIIRMTTTSVGLMADNMLRMLSWMDPVGRSGFVETWTQFYWAWWMSFSLFMGLFIARLSRGRTVRNVLMGSLIFGSLGCGVFFWIVGGFSMDLQLSGKLDVIGLISQIGENETIMAILRQLPMSGLLILLYFICGVLFLATTLDASTASLATVSQKNLQLGCDPDRRLVIFWSFAVVLMPIGILNLEGSVKTLQSAVVVGSLPIAFIMILLVMSFVKMTKNDNYFKT